MYGAAIDMGGAFNAIGAYGTTDFGGYGVLGNVFFPDANSCGVRGEEPSLVGWAVYAAGATFSFNGYFIPSDASLKEGIQTYNDGLQVVMQLNPATYEYKPAVRKFGVSDGKHVGFLAHEVQRVMPEMVKLTTLDAPQNRKSDKNS